MMSCKNLEMIPKSIQQCSSLDQPYPADHHLERYQKNNPNQWRPARPQRVIYNKTERHMFWGPFPDQHMPHGSWNFSIDNLLVRYVLFPSWSFGLVSSRSMDQNTDVTLRCCGSLNRRFGGFLGRLICVHELQWMFASCFFFWHRYAL